MIVYLIISGSTWGPPTEGGGGSTVSYMLEEDGITQMLDEQNNPMEEE